MCGRLSVGKGFLAVVSAVWNHPEGEAAAVKQFTQAIAAAAVET